MPAPRSTAAAASTEPTAHLTVQPVPPVLSLPQTQRLLGISKKLLQDLMHSGELPTIKLGDRRRVISGEALVAYLRRKQDATGRGQV